MIEGFMNEDRGGPEAAREEYIRSVLGQDDPAPAPIEQDLSPAEYIFLTQAMEKLIEKSGDRIAREYMMEDSDSGTKYRGRFTLERVRNPELEG